MPALINELIDKVDNVEIIRDQIAAILKVELANQAVLSGNPQPRVFVERSNPWDEFVDGNPGQPIINVWWDTSNFDGSASNIVERQKCEATYNIDCYACGISSDAVAGHNPGDRAAALECQRAVRLARNILMSGHYTYLAMRGVVWKRWPQTISIFQPQIDNRAAQRLVGGRIAFQVQFNELSPQVAGEVLELVSIEVLRAGTGELYLRADYPH